MKWEKGVSIRTRSFVLPRKKGTCNLPKNAVGWGMQNVAGQKDKLLFEVLCAQRLAFPFGEGGSPKG